MDKKVSKTHTEEREFRGCGKYAPLVFPSKCFSTHTPPYNHISYHFATRNTKNATVSILVRLRRTRYQQKGLEA